MPSKRCVITYLLVSICFLLQAQRVLAQDAVPDQPPKPAVVAEPDVSSALFVPGNSGALAPAAAEETAFSFYVYPDTKLLLNYNGGRQFYGGTASGLILWVDNQVYGPTDIPAGGTHLPYTIVGNSIAGDGSSANPWVVTTTVSAGNTGVQLQSVLRYLNGSNTIDFTTKVSNNSPTRHVVTLFHAGDIYLQFPNNTPDYGYGTFRAASHGIGATTSTGDYAFLFEPINPPANAYQEAYYAALWTAIGSTTPGSGFNNTFRTDYHDAAAGLQWTSTLSTNEARTVAHRLRLERVDLRTLDPRIDAPGFANWGEATALSRRQFVDTFSGGGSCPAEGECRLDPAAEQWYTRFFAQAGEGGHCYGMSIMTALFYRGIYDAASYDVHATVPFSLTRPNTALEQQVSIFHTFQNDVAIGGSISSLRSALAPNDILGRIRGAIAINNLDPYVLLIYGQSRRDDLGPLANWIWRDAGHAIVPYRIDDIGNDVVHVFVYDSNFEGDTNRFVEFNTQNNTWQYQMWDGTRPIGSFGSPGYWAGNSSNRNLSLVTMSAHTGQKPQLPYRPVSGGGGGGGGGGSWLAADADWLGNPVVTDSHGNRLGMIDGTLVNEIPGGIPIIGANSSIVPVAPSYYLPQDDYRVSLKSTVNTTTQSGIQLMGPGYAFTADSIDLSPTSQDTISVAAGTPAFEVQSSDASQEINLTYVYSLTARSAAGRLVNLSGFELGATQSISTSLDSTRGVLRLGGMADGVRSYDMQIVSQNGESGERDSVFAYPDMTVEPNTWHELDLSALDTTGTVSVTVVDQDGGVLGQDMIADSRRVLVSKDGNGTGEIQGEPTGLNCGADCAATYAVGTRLTLTAVPAYGSTFTQWSGACTGSAATCQITVQNTSVVTATFSLNSYALTVLRQGAGLGTVVGVPPGVDCGARCTGNYNYGTQVTLQATAGYGSRFVGWSGACSGTDPVCRVLVDASKSVAAEFSRLPALYMPAISH